MAVSHPGSRGCCWCDRESPWELLCDPELCGFPQMVELPLCPCAELQLQGLSDIVGCEFVFFSLGNWKWWNCLCPCAELWLQGTVRLEKPWSKRCPKALECVPSESCECRASNPRGLSPARLARSAALGRERPIPPGMRERSLGGTSATGSGRGGTGMSDSGRGGTVPIEGVWGGAVSIKGDCRAGRCHKKSLWGGAMPIK
ncbi:uncharacterized protein LOC127473319 isoform X1 [Manacus candei]|uniref:uncharacterized protein LOC127473319 isoform X1 n=1 Tax=Manacus candei TaxID=415023 RepID=UPI002226F1CA|nr:uncharacterized protein LOC127473319 isoform X1 [Manacus candei]